MASLTTLSVRDLLGAIRSASPTPGGGSAAALAGAAGASLFAMVAGLPKSRAANDDDTARLKAAGERCAALAGELEALIDTDSEAYELVMAAYKKPKGTDEEKAARSAAIQSAMRQAIAAPLAVMRVCAQAAAQGVVVARLGNPSADSDADVGFDLLAAALRGARRNVDVNLAGVKDQEYAAKIRGEAEGLERDIARETAAAARARATA